MMPLMSMRHRWLWDYQPDDFDARAEREANQDSEFSALVEAERNGDEPIDYDPDDLRWGEPSRA